jgi:hypothetical protein
MQKSQRWEFTLRLEKVLRHQEFRFFSSRSSATRLGYELKDTFSFIPFIQWLNVSLKVKIRIELHSTSDTFFQPLYLVQQQGDQIMRILGVSLLWVVFLKITKVCSSNLWPTFFLPMFKFCTYFDKKGWATF